MENKKIDIIVKYFYPIAAGIETNILETYSVLVKMGWSVTVHTSKDTLTEKNVLSDYEEIKGIKILRYPYRWYSYLPKIDWDKTDLVCLHNFNIIPHFLIMLYTLVRKAWGIKNYVLVVTPHGGFNPEWSIFPLPVAMFKRIYHFTIGALLVNSAVDGVRAVSEWEKKEMIKKGFKPEIIHVISNGIEDEAFLNIDKESSEEVKNKVQKIGKYIIQIGRIYSIKNYETAIKALTLTPSYLKFVIVGPVGNEDYKKKLESLIENLKLKYRVIFWGVIRGVDKFYLIKKAVLMVHMALWESFCNVVHEGMSQGLPIITANNTALPYLVKNKINGYLVETKDYNEVANRINFILKNRNSKEVQNIIRSNIKFAQGETWKRTAKKLNDFYLQLTK